MRRSLPCPDPGRIGRVGALAAAGLAAALALGPGCGAEGTEPAVEGERVYVVNVAGHSVSVIDPASMAVVAEIELGEHPHGQVAAPDGRTIYVTTDRDGGEVIAIDTATQSIAWRLDVGSKLHQPALMIDGRHLYVPEITTSTVFVIDVDERRVAAEIPLRDGDGPLLQLHNAYAGAGGRFIYQTALRGRALARIDSTSQKLDRLFHLRGQPRPAALLADESKVYLQYTRLHGFVEVDLATGKEIARIEWPEPPAAGVHRTKCHGIGIAPDETELWASSHLERGVRVYSLPGLNEVARIELGDRPKWIAFSPDGERVYVTIAGSGAGRGTVSVVDRRARRVVATIPVGAEPRRVHSVVVPSGRS